MKNFDTLFDDVRENAMAAAAAVSKQASRIYDASRYRISAEGIKRNIAKKLIELGKLTYKAATHEVDLSEDIANTVAEITELKHNLALVNAQIASIRNQKICPDCGNTVPQYSVFCNVCGSKFETEQPAAEEEAPAETETPVEEGEAAPEAVEEDITIAVAEEAADEESPAAEALAEEANEIVAAAEEAVEEIAEADEEAAPAAEKAVAAETDEAAAEE